METEDKFPIRSYSKSELASLYLPHITSKSAVCKLNKWIAHYPGLWNALLEIGFAPKSHYYTPAQVKLIVQALGEP